MAAWLTVLGCCAVLAAQTPDPPEDVLLSRVRARAQEDLQRIPNYTCAMTVERSQRRPGAHSFEPVDKVHLEVAVAGERELYSWPGAGKFGDESIEEFVPRGTVGNGDFAGHVSGVFVLGTATFDFAGEAVQEGRRWLHYNYRVPQAGSGYHVRFPPFDGFAGYHGSFWVDAATLDLRRLEIITDGLPPESNAAEAVTLIEFRPVRIGTSDFLLPASSDLSVTYRDTSADRNRTQFSGCRQYVSESVLSFGDDLSLAAPAKPQGAVVALPPGLLLDITLEKDIDFGKSAAGDPVTGRLNNALKKDGAVLVPPGALVSGRITELRRRPGPASYYVLAIQFFSLESSTTTARFQARLVDVSAAPTNLDVVRSKYVQVPTAARRRTTLMLVSSQQRRGLGVLWISGDSQRIPRGLRMLWKTEGNQP